MKLKTHHTSRALAHTLTGLSFVALVGSASLASAWEPLNGNYPTWPRLPVVYEINSSTAQELGATVAEQVIEQSYSNWMTPSCSGYRSQNQGTTRSSWRSGDGINTHIWVYNSSARPPELAGRETIGVTLTLYRGDEIVDGDILYNGIDHSWTTNPTRNGQVDAESIITHETGHQLGLGHSASTRATMYYAYVGGTGARSLDSDDIEGLCRLYPGSGATACSSDRDCSSGEQCANGTCVAQTQGEGGVGEPCATTECAGDLICVQGDGDPFCTLICSGGDCPSGWACQGVNSSAGAINLCLPSPDIGGNAGFGDGCGSGPECASGLCVSDGNSAFCSETCVDDGDCPSGGVCYALSEGGGACVPEGGASSGGYGDACMDSTQCDSELCIDDGSRSYCSSFCTQDGECPNGSGCYALESGEGVCVIESEMPTEPVEPTLGFDEPCESSEECLSGLCVDDGTRTFCSADCSDDADCPPSAICAELSTGGGACLPTDEPVSSGCATDEDCAAGDVCGSSGECYTPEPNEGGATPEPEAGDEVLLGGEEGPLEPDDISLSDDLGCEASGAQPLSPLAFLMIALLFVSRRRVSQRSKELSA